MEDKVIFINGFTQEETLVIMRAVKSVIPDPSETAFAMGTDTNRGWLVKDLIAEVAKEHLFMKQQAGQKNEG